MLVFWLKKPLLLLNKWFFIIYVIDNSSSFVDYISTISIFCRDKNFGPTKKQQVPKPLILSFYAGKNSHFKFLSSKEVPALLFQYGSFWESWPIWQKKTKLLIS